MSHTITFDGNGGTPDVKSMSTDAEGRLPYLPGAFRADYTFDAWYTQDGRRVAVEDVYTSDTTLYAHWSGIPVEAIELSRTDITV